MRDEFQDYTPDPSSQRSVSDWLMQVISGNKPEEPGKAAAQNGARPLANGTAAAAVLEEAPREPDKSGPAAVVELQPQRVEQQENAAVKSPVAEFTAEDLCGPPVIKPAAPAARGILDEITADDLCWVPEKAERNGRKPGVVEEEPVPAAAAPVVAATKGSIKIVDIEEMKPHVAEVEAEEPEVAAEAEPVAAVEEPVGAVELSKPELVAEVSAAKVVEAEALRPVAGAGEDVLTAADITRDRVLYAADAERMGMLRPLRKTEPAASAAAEPEREITAADIMRDRVLLQMQMTKPVEAEQVKAEPEAKAPDAAAAVVESAPEIEAAAAEAKTDIVEVPEAPAVELEASAAEPEAEASAAADAPMEIQAPAAEEIAVAEEPVTEFPAREAMETGESVFAHKGIWGDAARVEAHEAEDVTAEFSDQEPDYRASKGGYLKPEELEDLDEASPEKLAAALKGLARLGTVLPQLARTAEGGAAGDAGLSHEARHEVANLRMIQYEIRSTVHDHSLQLKRMEDQMIRVREAVDTDNTESAEMADSMKSTVKLVRMIGIGVGILLVILIAMVGFMLEHH